MASRFRWWFVPLGLVSLAILYKGFPAKRTRTGGAVSAFQHEGWDVQIRQVSQSDYEWTAQNVSWPDDGVGVEQSMTGAAAAAREVIAGHEPGPNGQGFG